MNVLDSKSERRQRVLNPRAAAIIAIAAVLFLFGTRRLHSRQFGKTVEFLRGAAYASLEAEDFSEAQKNLNQYLAFRSSDMDARGKLSSLLSTHIRTRPALEEAFHMNEELLRNNLPQQDLRLQQARIAVELGKYSDASAHLVVLQKLQEKSAEVWYLSGHCANEERKTPEAARCYQRALECEHPPELAFEELATLAAANPQLKLNPEDILDRMVTTCKSAEAFRLRAMRFMEKKKYSRVLPLVWKGLQSAPDDVALNAILVNCLRSVDLVDSSSAASPSGQINNSQEEIARAIRQLQECVERNPQQASFRIQLAVLFWEDHQQSAAVQTLEAGISRDSRAFSLHAVLIDYLLTLEQADKAERMLTSLPANALAIAETDLLTGRLQLLRKDWKAAEISLQHAVAYAPPGSGLLERSHMLLAVCRSKSGNAATAVDAFKTILSGAPESVPGRMGMASAWLKSGRKDLAIAEYRQLLDMPGVAAFLADLLIQRNLEQPAGLRNWNEVADLIRDQNPCIFDTTQRKLLQVDLLMASGRMTDAIAILETAQTANPTNSAFQRALARLNGERNSGLQERLQQVAIDSPDNYDVLAALMRLELGVGQSESALKRLDDIAIGQRTPQTNSGQSLSLAIRTAERVIELEQRAGRAQYVEFFCDAACRYAYQLATIDPEHEATLARVLAQQGRTSEAIQHLRSLNSGSDPVRKASAIMALVQYASPRQDILADSMRELVSMINANPGSITLRICYADALLYDDHLETASQVLAQIQNVPPDSGEVAARQAWIMAVESGPKEKAADLISHAIQRQPENHAFRVIEGRVLLAAGEYGSVLTALDKMDEKQLARAALTYKAAALLELKKMGEAWQVTERIRVRHVLDPMFPADEQLLQSVLTRLNQVTTAARTLP
ncbi:MAG: tetratricopeptide repeat protein [Planctomycetota bacterium]|nr:tetratricopeptide repeat protein [Planctomycetota bacterium]